MTTTTDYNIGETWRIMLRGATNDFYFEGVVISCDDKTLILLDRRMNQQVKIPVQNIFLATLKAPAPTAAKGGR